MLFFKKNERKVSDAFEDRLANVEKRLKNVENETLGLATENEIIRNKVLRKIQFKRNELNAEEPEDKTPKVLNSPFSIHM
jgi:hypothetical protein